MRIRLKGATLILGRLRNDGFRRVYAVRLADWSGILRLLRRAKIKARLDDGERLYIRPGDPDQQVFAFLQSDSPAKNVEERPSS